MKKIMISVVFWCFFLITGCATTNNTGAEFSPNILKPKIDMGTVVFYRPKPETPAAIQVLELGLGDIGAAMQKWTIAADDQKIALLGDETFVIVELPPGKYKFNGQTSMIDTIENVEIMPGIVQYIKAFRVGTSFGTSLILKEVDPDTAQNNLKGMKLQINPEKWAYTLSHGD